MSKKKYKYMVGDFETTVYDGQDSTEVWASACVELNTEDVRIFTSIEEQYDYFKSLNSHIRCYYHNLKFDGSFWLSYLMFDLGYKQAYISDPDDSNEGYWMEEKDMPNKSYTYCISNMGQWYNIVIKDNNKIIEFRDSLKLLPFSVDRIGKSFNTKHRKLNITYEGYRKAHGTITEEERNYIANDVLVVKEALEIMFKQGHNKLTIGSCCLSEYRRIMGDDAYKFLFPDVYEIELPPQYDYVTAGDWIRQSYRGGWCYVVKGKDKKVLTDGCTADVNSLYPSMMHSESGNVFPIGEPHFWQGNYIPDEAIDDRKYYFVKIKTRFYIRKNKLPFIQIKNNMLYKGTESLETSDIYNRQDGKYYSEYVDLDGNITDSSVVLTLTMTDYELIKEHYELVDLEILEGCWFHAEKGLFDDYINKYKKIKLESKDAERELAKLFLNNLYGKMASSKCSSFRVAFDRGDETIGFYTVVAYDKQAGYIPVGSAITSYARCFTIKAAQKNFYGADKRGFVYADTDSIHCDLPPEKIKGIKVHDKDFCCWKLEANWSKGYFVRQKTYIEYVTHENQIPLDNPYYNVKCAGMPKHCKDLFLMSMNGTEPTEDMELTDEELEFIKKKRDITDFDTGLLVPGKLLPKRIKGGVLLVPTTFEIR